MTHRKAERNEHEKKNPFTVNKAVTLGSRLAGRRSELADDGHGLASTARRQTPIGRLKRSVGSSDERGATDNTW